MSVATAPKVEFAPLRAPTDWPDHLQLPNTDGQPVENFLELPQSILLTDSIRPWLNQRHPDGQYAIGQNSGIYWRWTDPPLDGCRAPDWFYVPGVPPLILGDVYRRSYVLWKELVTPVLLLEFVSGDGWEERDRTPQIGKFWVYEQAIRAPFYGIYEVRWGRVEVYRLFNDRYIQVEANSRGHFEIPPMGVELGIWQGRYYDTDLPWLRWWDLQGNLLLCSEEKIERHKEREAMLAERLRQMGVNPEEIKP